MGTKLVQLWLDIISRQGDENGKDWHSYWGGDAGVVEELSGRDFAVLLNGRTSKSPMTTRRVATGRLFLRRRALHFSFLLEDGVPHPSSVQFLSDDGDILEELEPQTSPYEATNNRVCGTWTRLPRDYRTLLMEEKMWVALSPSDSAEEEDVISGLVARYVGVDSEVFSALLVPSPSPPSPISSPSLSGGGTAIISVDRQTDSLHISLVFNGIFASGENSNVTVQLQLYPERAVEPVTDTIILSKVFSDVNRAQVRTTLGERSLIRLTRGQVTMKLWSPTARHLELVGSIMPRATCNVFSAVLTPPSPQILDGSSVPSPNSAGWALVTLENDGTFQYEIEVEGGIGGAVRLETLQRRRPRVVEDLTLDLVDGRANGTYQRPTYRDLDALLRGRVQVVVGPAGGDQVLSGTLSPVAVTEALKSPHPTLLSSSEVGMAATVWMAVDSACVTHYDVQVGGAGSWVDRSAGVNWEPAWNLMLREEDHSWDPRHDMNSLLLEEQVEGWEVFAHSTHLSRVSLSRLGAGVSHMDLHLLSLTNSSTKLHTLTGKVEGVRVPVDCQLGSELSHPVGEPPQCGTGPCVLLEEADTPVVANTCVDTDMRVLEDGTSWPSPLDPCRMCMCSRGTITCHDMVCHTLDCPVPTTPPGKCCPVCPGGTNDVAGVEDRMCELNKQKHHLGSKWHPFLAPKGFDKCVSCSCVLNSRGSPIVNCSRFPCPPLPCGPDEMDHPEDACCPICLPFSAARPPPPTASPGMVNEGAVEVSREEHREMILRQGGCLKNNLLKENGVEWHPRMTSFGFYPCVTCKCKDGNITCASHQCPTLRCQNIVQDPQECCPRCATNSSTLSRLSSSSRHRPQSTRQRGRKPFKKGSRGGGGGRRMLNSG
ncbi:hypothetical protein Pmani_029456 [Petrolisthes manimaculis]|uniref:Chordin n=1 Tax=Petrolisthes manimaculis TaxID=1843537 RepID=A0AAE1TTV0_9EUCA|nr:hypothetical protein Pmani_029456 [Petrolisthes manimaculis]